MNIGKMLGDFLLSAWLWNITFDRFHPIVTGFVMFCLVRMVLRQKRMRALAISVGAQFFALCVLTVKVVCGFINWIDWRYEPLHAHEAIPMMSVLYPCLAVGVLYGAFQSLFFIGGRLFFRYDLSKLLIITWVSNGIGAFISYTLINMIELWYYVG